MMAVAESKIVELDDKSLDAFIKKGKSVIKVWGDGCGFCKEYAPVFEEYAEKHASDKLKFASFKLPKTASAFKRKYMKTDKNVVKDKIPCTMIFENGVMRTRQYGKLSAEQLADVISNEAGEQIKVKPAASVSGKKKVSLTIRRLAESMQPVKILMTMPFDLKTSYWIAKNLRVLDSEYDLIEQTKYDTIVKYGVKQANGEYKVKPENLDVYKKQIDEFMNTKVDLELAMIKINSIENIEPAVLLGIDFMLDESMMEDLA